MNLAELKAALDAADIYESYYSFDSGDIGEGFRIHRFHDMLGDGWEVYYSERGNKNQLLIHRSEAEACEDLFRRITRDPSTTRQWVQAHRHRKL